MKYTVLIAFFLTFVSCKKEINSTQKSIATPTEVQKKLKPIDLPIEVIQADITYLNNLIQVNNSALLRYELNISNNYRIPFTLQKAEIYDFQNADIPLAIFDSDYIDEHFERPGNVELDDLRLLSGNQFGILNLNLILNEGNSIPKQIFHKLYFERQKKNGDLVTHPMELAVIDVPPTNNYQIGFPFKKKGKWLYEAESHQGAHFLTEGRITYAQRFAIDWTLIDNNGHFAKNNTKENENWKTYGVEVIAVADGTIVDIKDGIIENTPLEEEMAVRITRETIAGNYIVIDIGNNLYALYGHLIPNSLKVNIGDRVKKGQVVGLIGNSGNSDAPHLHFHLETKSNSAFGGEGTPYHLNDFILLKKYSLEEVTNLFNSNNIPLDSLKFSNKVNEFPNGYGLIEVK